MKKAWFYILLSLAERERHGSAIMRDVLELTDGGLKLWPVALYGSLDELTERGWIRALDAPPAGADATARQKWFRITPAGRRALAGEVTGMQSMVQVAARRLASDAS